MEQEFLWLSIIYNYMRCHPKPIAEVIFFKMVIAPPTSDNCMGWWLWMTAWHFYQYLPYRKKCVHYTDWIWLYLFCLIVDAQQKARDSHRGSGPRWLKQRDSNVPWMRVKEHVFFNTIQIRPDMREYILYGSRFTVKSLNLAFKNWLVFSFEQTTGVHNQPDIWFHMRHGDFATGRSGAEYVRARWIDATFWLSFVPWSKHLTIKHWGWSVLFFFMEA